MSHDVFISHSSADKLTADAAVAALEAHGIRCWVAPRDVVPGVQWAEAIVRAITACRLMVLVFSSETNDSDHIVREVELAAHHRKPIIPLRVENVLPSPSLDYFISGTHWLDAIDPPLEAHLERLSAVVDGLLERHPAEAEPSERGAGTVPAASPFAPEAAVVAVVPPSEAIAKTSPSPSVHEDRPGGVAVLLPPTVAPPLPPAPVPVATAEPSGRPSAPRSDKRALVVVIAAMVMVALVTTGWLVFASGDEGAQGEPGPAITSAAPGTPSATAPPSRETVVKAPSNVHATGVTSASVVLEWKEAPFGTSVDHFIVLRNGKRISGELSRARFVDDEVVPGGTYVYRVIAIGTDGSKARSQSTDQITVPVPAPAPSSGSSSDAGGSPPSPTCSGIQIGDDCIPD